MTELELKLRKQRYDRTYYERHREKVKARALAWYYSHKEQRRQYMLAYKKL